MSETKINQSNRWKIATGLLVVALCLSLFVALYQVEFNKVGVAAQPSFIDVSVSGARTKLGVNDPETFTATVNSDHSASLQYTWSITPSDNKTKLTPQNYECVLEFLEATEEAYSLSCQVKDLVYGNQGSGSIAVYDPYTSPSLYLGAYGAPYSYLIETDGLGWYRAINGQTGQVSFTSTNTTELFIDIFSALTVDRTHQEKVVAFGSFTITSGIPIPSNVYLDLYSAKFTVNDPATFYSNSPSDCPAIFYSSLHNAVGYNYNITIAGGELDGSKSGAAHDTDVSGIYLREVTNCLLMDIYIHDFDTFGAVFEVRATTPSSFTYRSQNNTMLRCIVDNCDWDNLGVAGDDTYFIDCISTRSGRCGVTAENAKYVYVRGGSYTNNVEFGVEFGVTNVGNHDFGVYDSKIICNGNGQISATYCSNFVAIGNVACNSTSGHGIYMFQVVNATLSGNTFAFNGGSGVRISTGCSGILFDYGSNQVHDNGLNFFIVTGSLKPCGATQLTRLTDPLLTLTSRNDSSGAYTTFDFDSGTSVPPNAVGAVIIVRVNDAGSSGYTAGVMLRTKGETDLQQTVYALAYHINDAVQDTIIPITFDNNKQIEYREITGGSGTLDVQFLLWGWMY